MKLILEISEVEAIVKENIESKNPNKDVSVSAKNKRTGIEVTVVITDKKEKETVSGFENASAELVATGCCGRPETEEETLS